MRVLIVALCLFGAGCHTSARPVSAREAPVTSRAWQLEFNVSGGIAGIARSLTLESSGAFEATDRKRGLHVQGRLAGEAMRPIGDQVQALLAAPSPPGSAAPSRCRDCFRYTLRLSANQSQREMSFDSLGVADKPQAALVRELSNVLAQQLVRPPSAR